MRIYQYMLKQCTMSGMTSDIPTHPHRQFFGITSNQFTHHNPNQKKKNALHPPYGLLPFDKFLHCDSPQQQPPAAAHDPLPADIPKVHQILHSKGLPTELVLEIMARAAYAPRGRLQVPHDPFHRDNRAELAKYLKFCWEVLVRCDMMATALGMVIPWREVVSRVMVGLFSCGLCHGPRRWYVCDAESGDYTFL